MCNSMGQDAPLLIAHSVSYGLGFASQTLRGRKLLGSHSMHLDVPLDTIRVIQKGLGMRRMRGFLRVSSKSSVRLNSKRLPLLLRWATSVVWKSPDLGRPKTPERARFAPWQSEELASM